MARNLESRERRRFLQRFGAGALAVAGASACKEATGGETAPRTHAPTADSAAGRSRVVVVRAKRTLVRGYDADRAIIRAMLEAGLAALAGKGDAANALARYLRPGERIGLKINGLAGRNAATHVELVDELSSLLAKAGVEPSQQIAFDRFKSDLVASGFSVDRRSRTYRCVGNDESGHEEELAQMTSSASRLCKVLTRQVDGVVNLPVLKQHMLSGVTGALKNNFGCIHNPNKMHIDNCDPYIAEVNALPAIRSKQRLVIMDALRPVVDNGPSYQPGMGEVANTLIFATDLVAIDTVGLDILEQLRHKRGLPALAQVGLRPTYLGTAARLGLGVATMDRIDVVSVEV